MRPFVRFWPSLALLLFMTASALAQTEYRIELFGAGSFPKDKDFLIGQPQSSPPLRGSYQLSNAARGGVRVGVDFKKHWGEDFIYSYGSNASKIVNTTDPSNQAVFPFTVRSHQIAFNGLWYPTGLDSKKKIFPYVTAGVGTTFFVLTPEELNSAMEAGLGQLTSEHIFAFNAGGGIRMRWGGHFGFRADVRDFMSRPPRFGLPKSSNNPTDWVFPTSGVFHLIETSFALVYHF